MTNTGKLSLRHLRKEYPGTVAVEDFSADFEAGRIHALIGKNGSGKSTLINMISGIIPPTAGEIYLDGERIYLTSPLDAMKKGIATVHQEMSLVPQLSVAENIALGQWKKKGIKIDWERIQKIAEETLAKVDPTIDPKAQVKNLSVGQQQIVEIAKAMSSNPAILILDEPTSALASQEVERLFEILKNLRLQGVTQIYISHRLHELKKIADSITVIRDGVYIDKQPMEHMSHEDILKRMFGEIKPLKQRVREKESDNIVLELKNLTRKDKFSDISFKLYEGEILGIAGMLGSGRSEILRAIFGIEQYDHGEVWVHGEKIKSPSPFLMKKYGLCYTSEDRKHEGLVQMASTHNNLCLAALKHITKSRSFISKKMEDPYVQQQITDLHIKVPSTALPVASLSGGNQQKVVVGNWLNTQPKIILCDEPSRGVDVEAKQQIFKIIQEQSTRSIASILVSTELEELLEVCDRILILHNGAITGAYSAAELDVQEIYKKAMGAD